MIAVDLRTRYSLCSILGLSIEIVNNEAFRPISWMPRADKPFTFLSFRGKQHVYAQPVNLIEPSCERAGTIGELCDLDIRHPNYLLFGSEQAEP